MNANIMEERVKEVITGMTDGELLEAVEKTYSGYTREALEIAMAELKRRGISFTDKTAYYPRASEVPDIFAEEIEEEFSCPKCGDKMAHGSVYLRNTAWDWLFYGPSFKHVFFKSMQDSDEEKVIDNNGTNPAYRCKKCGLVLFETTG